VHPYQNLYLQTLTFFSVSNFTQSFIFADHFIAKHTEKLINVPALKLSKKKKKKAIAPGNLGFDSPKFKVFI
jgi:hypothetical protein